MKFTNEILIGFIIVLFSGCASSTLVTSQKPLPSVYVDANETHDKKTSVSVSLFVLNNYTDTPRAGLRAASIVEGILLAKGYNVTSHMSDKAPSMKEAQKIAQEDGSKYYMYGGVSEWRYKTGIDGEPAVSISLALYTTKNANLAWSATGADSSWGNASIGTTAQKLLLEMMQE